MTLLIALPFIIQSVAIGIDEGYFHVKRGLPKWERIGHPIDTLSIIACMAFVLLVPFERGKIIYYAALAIFSCLLVTKDEFVHKHHCTGAEQWLHALLFINHPVLLCLMGLVWPSLHGSASFLQVPDAGPIRIFFIFQLSGIFLFFLYQVIYWNILWKKQE